MKKINVAYDFDYNEDMDSIEINGLVDIMEVPDEIANNLDEYVQKFFDWFACAENNQAIGVNSDNFEAWINTVADIKHNELAKVIETNVKFDPSLPIAEF